MNKAKPEHYQMQIIAARKRGRAELARVREAKAAQTTKRNEAVFPLVRLGYQKTSIANK